MAHSNNGNGKKEPSSLNRRLLLISGLGLAVAACSKEESVQVVAKPDSTSTPSAPPAASPASKAVNAPDIQMGTFLIPGLVNSSNEGPVIDLVNAIAATYKGGKFIVNAAPIGRVVSDIQNGASDAFVPDLRIADEAKLQYRYSTASIGKVHFVLYSRKSAPVSAQDVRQAKGKSPADFPYKIESTLIPWGFPTIDFTDMTSALKKLAAGHIHAFLWAQEEADAELRKLGLKDIVREEFGVFEDVFALVKGPRGDFVDGILSAGIKQLHDAGELQRLYAKIHRPYDPWQP